MTHIDTIRTLLSTHTPDSLLDGYLARISPLPADEIQFLAENLPAEIENEPDKWARAVEILEGVEYSVEKETEQRAEDERRDAERKATRAWIDNAEKCIIAACEAAGEHVEVSGSNVSEAVYLTVAGIKIRIAAHDPRPTYERLNGRADVLIGPHQAAHIEGFGEDLEAAIAYILEKIGTDADD